MPRKARQESCTGVYHVIIRGNNKNWITHKNKYKQLIKKLIFQQEEFLLIEIYAWCIMNNHVHLILYSKKENMAKALFNINRLFAMKYNFIEGTVGHVFENRYKSECIENEKYLIQAIRYVHNNPVKAKIVKEPQNYEWSSFRSYISKQKRVQEKIILKTYFNDSIEGFIAYHKKEDDNEHLEIKEDVIKYKEDEAQKIIEKYCKIVQGTSIEKVKKNVQIRNEMIVEMIQKSKLSYRRVAEIMGMSVSCIYKIQKISQKREHG